MSTLQHREDLGERPSTQCPVRDVPPFQAYHVLPVDERRAVIRAAVLLATTVSTPNTQTVMSEADKVA